jgi:hypothetical protein
MTFDLEKSKKFLKDLEERQFYRKMFADCEKAKALEAQVNKVLKNRIKPADDRYITEELSDGRVAIYKKDSRDK